MRNIEKNIEQGRAIVRKRPGLDLSIGELEKLMEIARQEPPGNELFRAVSDAFLCGIAIASRNA